MLRSRMTFRIALLLFLAAPALRAGIVLDRDPLELYPKADAEEIETDFAFTNCGNRVVRITGLESSCSCLEASLDKPVYAPGEKGRGRARFKVGSFTGRHEKALRIRTDDPSAPDVVLSVVIDVPVIVSVEPKLLEWALGSKAEPKEFLVRMLGPDPIRITGVNSTRDSVAAGFKETLPGREYRISVTPASTSDVIIGAVTIHTDSAIPKYRRQMAFYSIVRERKPIPAPDSAGEGARK